MGELAEPFDMSFAAAANHVKVLDQAGSLSRTIEGRSHRCQLAAERIGTAGGWHCHLTILVEKREGRTPPAFWDVFRKIDAEYASGIPR